MGSTGQLLIVNRQAHEKEIHYGREKKPRPHEVGGAQIPFGVHSELPHKNAAWTNEAAVGHVPRSLAAHMESRIEEGHLMSGHMHMMIAIPPKYAVSQGIG